MYKIIDNFLPEEAFLEIRDNLMGDQLPWTYNHSIVNDDEKEKYFQFVHVFYSIGDPKGQWFDVIRPLISRLDPIILIRAKANLTPRSSMVEEHGFHTDFDFDCTTAIYYINDNNGYTILEDGSKIESVSNRLVEFDSSISHTGTTHTDAKVRVVINLNYKRQGGKQ